ncbi:MAG: DUF58 domain-containing protein [Nocardioidaceae bacterium]
MPESEVAAPWKPTHAYVRAGVLAVALLVGAVLFHSPALAVVATPFVTVTAWSLVTRPRDSPVLRHPVTLPTLREGEAMRWQLDLDAVRGLDHAAVIVERADHQVLRPASGACVMAAQPDSGPRVTLEVLARAVRWGHQSVGRSRVSATSSWGAFRWGTVQIPPVDQAVLPVPAVFDAAAPTPHPMGLVGLNRSARRGEGSEFATIRPFQVGDRLKRIHWPMSLRSQTLHVTSTWADEDAEIMLLVDASTDLGRSEGIDGFASSLDVTVRAAGAVAEHFLRHSDRVGLCVFGPSLLRIPPAAGRAHLRKLLHRLADTKVGNRDSTSGALLALRLGSDTLVVMLSACVSQLALQQAATMAARGTSVIVVDTLPGSIGGIDDPALTVAWRIRRLERATELRELARRGVPVVTWSGPGSLDMVLRDLGRRSAAPRMARR